MKKLFVFGDAHSYLTPLKEALDAAGFDPTNEDHWLVSCGDLFDRGPESEELLKFIMSIERKVLVKGNHDSLLEALCFRGFPYSHDKQNGTVRTVYDLSGSQKPDPRCFDELCVNVLGKTSVYRNSLVNYFETENYIFVHSWVPLNKEGYDTFSYKEDWRTASDEEWDTAMWGNPFFSAHDGLNKTGKTVVFGHWHCSFGHAMDSGFELSEFEENACWEPYINTDTKVIGVDTCTNYTKKVNVVVLEDNFLSEVHDDNSIS